MLKGLFYSAVIVVVIAIGVNYYLHENLIHGLRTLKKSADDNKIVIGKDVHEKQFKIEYNQKDWNDLVGRLENTRYFQPLEKGEASGFEFGFSVDYAKELVNYWKTKFDWENQVKLLNKFNHYQIKIDGVNVHFMRYNSHKHKNSKKVPLLLLSGWPGSFYEFYKAIELISEKHNNEKRHFDIVVASIPGYGYSIPLTKRVNSVETARLFDALMRHLFDEECKYYVHGEDWGSFIGYNLVKMYPTRVKGFHTSMAVSQPSLTTLPHNLAVAFFPQFMLTKEEIKSNISFGLFNSFKKIMRESGYFHLQVTKPDTVGFGLTDSPVGLMTYILEKYSGWSSNYEEEVLKLRDGGLKKFSKDDLLTIVTLYWMTNTITSSVRFYKNNVELMFGNSSIEDLHTPRSVPIAVLQSPNELMHSPLCLLKQNHGNIKQYTVTKSGGHFIAFEEPEMLVEDLMKFIHLIE